MPRSRLLHARPTARLVAILAGIAVALLVAAPAARADGASDDVAAAKAALSQAQAAATAAQDLVASDRAQLAEAESQLAAMNLKVTGLDAEVASDQAQVAQLTAEIAQHEAELAAFLRASYEAQSTESAVDYIVDAGSVSDLMERITDVSQVASAGNTLVATIASEQHAAQSTLAADNQAQSDAQAAQAQMATQEVIIAGDEATATEDAAQAQATVGSDQQQLNAAVQREAAQQAAAGSGGVVYQPIAGPVFTEDTDLTLPSGENAQTINDFLAGTDLAGLGDSYMQAEEQFHVSARYLVAHSIEESGWGTSAIAQQKHNLFGYGADDSDPYGDAMTFSSFSACILYVAQVVSKVYLTPGGTYYHGPTLRGMNVDYASDPNWAVKIAAIAQSIPLPAS
jgi:beta-N-acetylglucosaminidase